MLDNKHSEPALQCFYCFADGCILCRPLTERFDENSADGRLDLLRMRWWGASTVCVWGLRLHLRTRIPWDQTFCRSRLQGNGNVDQTSSQIMYKWSVEASIASSLAGFVTVAGFSLPLEMLKTYLAQEIVMERPAESLVRGIYYTHLLCQWTHILHH